MGKFKFIVAMLGLTGLALLLGVQYSFNVRLRRDNEALRGVIAELRQTQGEREPAVSEDGASKEQLDELLKLRGEVTQLREQTNQIAALVDANQKLGISLSEVKTVQTNVTLRPMKNPEDALPQDIHPKESWGYRGYSTPDAAIESMCWAMFKGDKAAFLAGLSPEMLKEIQPQVDEGDFSKDNPSKDMGEFRILDRQAVSDDAIVMTVYSTRKDAKGDYTGSSENTLFKRIEGQWKIANDGVKSPNAQ